MATQSFDIHISARPKTPGQLGSEYPVQAESSVGEPATGKLTLDLNDDEFRKLRAKIEGTAPDLTTRTEFGRMLFKQLFANDIRDLWSETRGKLAANVEKPTLHVRLRMDAPELAVLPWELLYDDRTKNFLATSANTVLSRFLPAVDSGDLPPQHSLRILLAVADPRGPLDLPAIGQAAIEQVEDAINGLGARAESVTLRSANVARIQQQLQRLQPHVLHVIAHGVAGEILLVSDDKTTMSPLTENAFSQLFANRANLRLVFLNVCQSAQAMSGSVFSGIGPALVGRGIPAVIAMQYGTVQLETASLFSRAFYEAVTNNITVEAAVNEARQRISASELVGDRDWSTPVLYVGTKTGKIIEIVANAPTPAPVTQNASPAASKALTKELFPGISESRATIRRARRIELALLDLEKSVRELAAEVSRPNGEATVMAVNDKLNNCISIIPRLDDVEDVPVATPSSGSTKYPTATEIMQILEKIEQTPISNQSDMFRECNRLVRLIQFATNTWRRINEKELDSLFDRIASLAQG